jgi:hypothetical protein
MERPQPSGVFLRSTLQGGGGTGDGEIQNDD